MLAKRCLAWFCTNHTLFVRHAYLPFGHQATLLYDVRYPPLQILASYEQSHYELTGKVPSHCTTELNLSQFDYKHDLRADYLLEQQQIHFKDKSVDTTTLRHLPLQTSPYVSTLCKQLSPTMTLPPHHLEHMPGSMHGHVATATFPTATSN